MEPNVSLKLPFIKWMLLVDEDPDVTLAFKVRLDGIFSRPYDIVSGAEESLKKYET